MFFGGLSFADQVTMKYSGTTTANMTGENDASLFGLDADAWSVVGNKGANSNMPGLNKAGDFRLYWSANGGNTITVQSLAQQTISKIAITFTGASYSNVSVTVDGNAVTGTDGVFDINSTSFVLGNANTSNTQVRISEIVITYGEAGQADKRIATTIELSGAPTTAEVGATIALPTAVVKAGDATVEGATVTWSSANEAVAIIDGAQIKALAAGTVKITATYDGDETNYKGSTTDFTLTVTAGPYTSIAAILADITSTHTPVIYQFENLLVTYVNGQNTFVSDGRNGFLFYGANLGLAEGSTYTGSVIGDLYTYNGLPEIAASADGINARVVSEGNLIAWQTIAPADLQNYINIPVTIKNAVFVEAGTGKNLTFKVGDENVAVYNQWSIDVTALEADKAYTLKGIGSVYSKNETTTYQLYLASFEEATDEPDDEPTITGTIFSATVIATNAQSFATGTTEITSEQATIEGGKMYAVSEQTDAKNLINKQGGVYYFSMTNNNTYFKVELDHALAVGDIITADGLGGIKNDAEKGLWISTSDSRPNDAPACSGTNATESIVKDLLNYTIKEGDEYVGATTIYIYRSAGATEYFGNFKITRPAGDEPGEEPGDEPGDEPHDPVVLTWDYTEANIPTTGPDNGLYYASYVNDPAGTNNGMHGAKLNSSGYAFFAKPAVAGTLTLTIGNRKTAAAYAVNVYSCTIANGVATKGDLIGEVAVDASPGTGSIEIGKAVTGIYIERKTSAEGVLSKIVFKEIIPRTFVDFEITNAQLSGEFDTSTLPTGVTFFGTQRNDSHGYGNVTLVVPVDGTVKFTIGGCRYANPATCKVTNAEGEVIAEPNLKTAKCYHEDGTATTYLYTGKTTTLTFSNIAYLPYFKAEATEVSEATITYLDQDGKKLGEKVVYEGEAIGEVPYTEADLTIAEGMKFRGWIYTNNVKVQPTDVVTGNVTVKASVTAIESVSVGSIQTYDLTVNTFYPEDHETIDIAGGKYYNNHGWDFAADGTITVDVAGNAQIILTLCQYGNGTTIKVTDAEGNIVKEDVPAKAESDGGIAVVQYQGEATKLTFTFAAQTYLHKVTVYNVKDFLTKDEQSGYYIVPAGDAASLIMALNSAASEEGAKVFLPNGTYDLGETVKTAVSGKNVSIIGQSAEGTIIVNHPSVAIEGLDKADLLKNSAEGLYMQDLTLKNDMAYSGNDGRAATLHDVGTKTINKNVIHLSHQDTYYSNKTGGLYYFEGGEIHGTVDYLCGDGRVYFNEVTLVNEQRSSATITANSELYVFNNCTVENNANQYNLGRAWSNNPVCIWLNTTLKDGGEKLIDTRWNLKGINCDYSIAGEYGTKNAAGEDITPQENTITFSKANTTLNTILSAEQAATYTIDYTLGDWAATAQQQTLQIAAPDAQFENGNIVWQAVEGATAYAIFKNDMLVAITTETSLLADDTETALYTIRSANARGGFGLAAEVTGKATGIETMKAGNNSDAIYNLQGIRVDRAAFGTVGSSKGIYIVNGKKVIR